MKDPFPWFHNQFPRAWSCLEGPAGLVLRYVDGRAVEHNIKVPGWLWKKLKSRIISSAQAAKVTSVSTGKLR